MVRIKVGCIYDGMRSVNNFQHLLH